MGRILAFVALAVAMAGTASPGTAASPASGQATFRGQCSVCHSAVRGAGGVGPSLFGVIGRRSGTQAGYNYSQGMKAARLIWTQDQVKIYLAAPRKTVPGTKMGFAGLSDPKKLEDLVAYLATLK
jgi:cytochrome c